MLLYYIVFGLAALAMLPKKQDEVIEPEKSDEQLLAEQAANTAQPRNWKTGEMIVACGASQSGKTYWVREQLKNVKRLLVWDCEAQYEDICTRVCTSISELMSVIKKNPRVCKISYQPNNLKDFDAFCQIAFLFCDFGLSHLEKNGEPMRTYIVAEEISDVTSPSKAPNGWGILLRRGLKRNAYIFGVTQRPSESDKTIIGNCSQMHVCGLSREGDAQYLARELRVPVSEVDAIDRSKFQFIHKNMRTGQIIKG